MYNVKITKLQAKSQTVSYKFVPGTNCILPHATDTSEYINRMYIWPTEYIKWSMHIVRVFKYTININ